MNSSKKMYSILAIVLMIALSIPFLYTVVISFHYNGDGSVYKDWVLVGFDNYVDFLSTYTYSRLVQNSVRIGLFSMILGAAYTFCAAMSVGSAKSKRLKGVIAFVFCLPAVIPMSLSEAIITYDIIREQEFVSIFLVSLFEGLRLAGLISIAALFIDKDVYKESFKCMLLFVALKLIRLFTVNLDLANISNYEYLCTLTGYIYDHFFEGFMSSTARVVNVLIQIIPAAISYIILDIIFKKKANFKTKIADFIEKKVERKIDLVEWD